MQIGRIARAAAASLAALAIAGPAGAYAITIGTGDSSYSGIVLSDDSGMQFLRGLIPTVSYTTQDSEHGAVLVVFGSVYSGDAAQEQATFGPIYQDVVAANGAAAMPEPSGALLMALGMTLTGAHLRSRKAR